MQDDRDEWQRLADLLTAASGMPVSAEKARDFFRAPSGPGRPLVPAFDRMHESGGLLYCRYMAKHSSFGAARCLAECNSHVYHSHGWVG